MRIPTWFCVRTKERGKRELQVKADLGEKKELRGEQREKLALGVVWQRIGRWGGRGFRYTRDSTVA